MWKKDNEVKRETGLNFFILVSLVSILQTLGSVIANSSTVVDYKFAILTSSNCGNETIAAYTSWTNAVVENFSGSANFSYEIHDFCDAPSLLNQLLATFEDPSISSVITITDFSLYTYIMHIVQQPHKLLIAANQPFRDEQNLQHVIPMYPGFDQMSLILERVLRHFQWQNVTLFKSSDPYWWTFNSVIYMTLTKFGYNVVNGEILPNSNNEAIVKQWWTTNVKTKQGEFFLNSIIFYIICCINAELFKCYILGELHEIFILKSS